MADADVPVLVAVPPVSVLPFALDYAVLNAVDSLLLLDIELNRPVSSEAA